jgi:thiol-disulfide isomerase/thioredoxin
VNVAGSSKNRLAGALIGGGVAAVAAGAVGFFAYRYSHPAPEPLVAAAPAVTAPEPPAPEGSAKKVPDTLPDITLADRDGKPTKLASFGGRPLMVNFWATWCAPCRREIPLLNKIRMERRPQNAEIVGIAVDFKEDVAKFLQKVPLQYPLLIGEEDGLAAAEAFGMGMAFPFSVFSDSQNRILTIKIGELHEDEANFAFDRLQDIDAGVITLEAAQAAVAEAFSQMAANRAQAETSEDTKQAH